MVQVLRASKVILALAAVTAPIAISAPAQADEPYQVLLDRLNNPRGVTVAANGSVYVAEAGTGGDIPAGEGEEGPSFLGLTGQIRVVDPATGATRVVVDGLVSMASEDGGFAIGVDGVAASGSTVCAIMGLSSRVIPDGFLGPEADAARAQLGRLIKANPSGQWKTVSDVVGYDFDNSLGTGVDGDDDLQDANPYGVLATPGQVLVADAGSNTVTGVRTNGTPDVRTVVPKNPTGFLSDAVPTCIAPAGDGGHWVGTLDGQVHHYNPSFTEGSALTLSGDLPQSVGGCASDGNGGLFVTDQLSGLAPQGGTVTHISATGHGQTVLDSLDAPAGLALSRDGHSLYVTVGSVQAGGGQFLEVPL